MQKKNFGKTSDTQRWFEMKRKVFVLGTAGMLAVGIGFEATAQEEAAEEELLFVEIPMLIIRLTKSLIWSPLAVSRMQEE